MEHKKFQTVAEYLPYLLNVGKLISYPTTHL